MAKKKAKKKTKAKPKVKAKPRAKAKAKPRAKAKSRAKAKPKPRAQAKARSAAGNIPITVTPDMCDSFTANTGDYVAWQLIPTAGCQVTKGNTAWPFNVPYPINLTPVSNTRISVTAGHGIYQIVVSCCSDQGLKTVTVP